ncbi:hypothetical protein KY290_036404 [Solanum tuberosum]|uniref:Uncharacterized protein n=1 Tax=Solanum tuberosum TaxID=4113 RepID=A0ABQ7TTW9_SOLTU|nr:hypothetical protein KY285_035702 [Solanum tuberosum]KAH0737699.1 hypothetical protein KY290_036404 [Solanum tuberosum]
MSSSPVIPLHSHASSVTVFNGLNFSEWHEQLQFHLGVMDLDLALLNDKPTAITDVDQSDTTSRRPFTRSQGKDLQALQALWMKMEPLEGTNMEDLKIFNILSALPF